MKISIDNEELMIRYVRGASGAQWGVADGPTGLEMSYGAIETSQVLQSDVYLSSLQSIVSLTYNERFIVLRKMIDEREETEPGFR